MIFLKLIGKNNAAYIIVLFFLLACNTQPGDNAAAAKADTIIIQDMKFNPAALTAHKGDTVVFINKDLVSHDVTDVKKEFYSDTIRAGNTWKWAAKKNLDYICSIHPVMKGKIIVKQ